MIANPDNTSIADIFVELWKKMSPEKRANTIAALETLAGDSMDTIIDQTRYVLFLADSIVNSQVPVQA